MKTSFRVHSVTVVGLALMSVAGVGCYEESNNPVFVESEDSASLYQTINDYKISWERAKLKATAIEDHEQTTVINPLGENLGQFFVIPDNNIYLFGFKCPNRKVGNVPITAMITNSRGDVMPAQKRKSGENDVYEPLSENKLYCSENEQTRTIRVLNVPDGAYKIKISAGDKTSIREFFFDTVPPEVPVMLSPTPLQGISTNSSTINIEDPSVTFKGRVASDVIYLKGEVSDPSNSTVAATNLVLRLERSTGEFTFHLDIGFKETRTVRLTAVDVAGHESPPLVLTVFYGGAMELIQPMFSAIGLPVLQSEGMEGNQVRLTAVAGGSVQAHRHPSGTTAPPQIGDEDAPYWISSLFLDWVRKKQTTETSH